jgi:hypothetical protein
MPLCGKAPSSGKGNPTKCHGYRQYGHQITEFALYSPPPMGKRLPKEEPRPQRGKSMTIAAGFQCIDGVLLLADSKHKAVRGVTHLSTKLPCSGGIMVAPLVTNSIALFIC